MMPARKAWLRFALALLLAWQAFAACADVFRPAYLELREAGEGRYDVLWKVPAQGGDMRLAATVRFPADTVALAEPNGVFSGGSHVQRWQVRRDGGLAGQTIRVEGIAGGVTDVIVRVERQDGSSQTGRLVPERPAFVVEAPAGTAEVAWSYLRLGVEHILGGFDHLLFVLALLLIVRGGRRIVATVTAFTVAHSITLVAATLGWVHVPAPPVEASIALSIVFVASEVVHGLRGQAGLTARAPWVVAFVFGLLHGFGFAGALAEVGLPHNAIPVALLMFNVGVEIGQLAFIAAVFVAGTALAKLRVHLPRWAHYVPAYAIGSVAMVWTIERVAALAMPG
jgi:hydrogenase/urease accessory protein HupE